MASITDQNWVVWNQGKNPLVNFNFMLRVELAVDLPCKSVRAFSRELEYDYIQEGGLNDYVHMRRKPITRPFTLEIERYVGVDYLDPLPLGTDLTLPVLLFVSRNHDQFIPGVVARTYVFTGCTVMKKTYGDLVADQSGLLVETTTLGYREMLCVDIPWSEVGDNISKDVKTVPTAARTLDKSAAELKALGNELYLQAQAAKEQAETVLSAQDAQALIDELTGTLADLRAAVDKGGSLVQAADRAEAGRNGAGGHPKTELADQAQAAAQQAEKDFRAKEQLAQEADAALYRAEDALRQAKEAVEGPEGRVKDLTAQLEQDAAERKALEDKLPEDIRTAAAAQTAVAAAQQARNEAEEALTAAQQAKQDAIAQAQQREDYAPAREKAAQTAKALTAAQQERDQAVQAADTARREYEAALRTWQEHQNDQLERAAARTGFYEDQLRIAQDGLKHIQRQMDLSGPPAAGDRRPGGRGHAGAGDRPPGPAGAGAERGPGQGRGRPGRGGPGQGGGEGRAGRRPSRSPGRPGAGLQGGAERGGGAADPGGGSPDRRPGGGRGRPKCPASRAGQGVRRCGAGGAGPGRDRRPGRLHRRPGRPGCRPEPAPDLPGAGGPASPD